LASELQAPRAPKSKPSAQPAKSAKKTSNSPIQAASASAAAAKQSLSNLNITAPVEFAHGQTKRGSTGAKVKGWEDLDFIRLANAAGISVTYLREALTGRRVISLAGMKMIAKTLGFTLDQLAARIEKAQEFYKRRDGVRKFKSNERGMEER